MGLNDMPARLSGIPSKDTYDNEHGMTDHIAYMASCVAVCFLQGPPSCSPVQPVTRRAERSLPLGQVIATHLLPLPEPSLRCAIPLAAPFDSFIR